MLIAGGLYRELCDVPVWDATMGSGGRAALAISSLSPGTELFTYASEQDHQALAHLHANAVATIYESRPTPIVFAYFHPLSSPHVEPNIASIGKLKPLRVAGDAVLRFGFTEGEAVVSANRAVYDPQTWRDPPPFGANGSQANELAIVLNERELRSSTGLLDTSRAAQHLITEQKAKVVIVKMGTRGAKVFEADGTTASVPAYRTDKVFKIGSGDVFTAMFAYHWAEKNFLATEAADLASRFTAMYCNTQLLQFESNLAESFDPIYLNAEPTVRIEGASDSLGRRYVLEEARFALAELGMKVTCPTLDSKVGHTATDVVLVIDDGLSEKAIGRILQDSSNLIPVVWLNERKVDGSWLPQVVRQTDDFTTAMYWASWAHT